MTRCPAGPARRDHPRSRGVYHDPLPGWACEAGSSPLARGLLSSLVDTLLERRIIPARAGFTERRQAGPAARRDHPRSRGVYCGPGRPGSRRRGSSPLARGLPAPHVRGVRRVRIIPARAGFTLGAVDGVELSSDHPRSRGVYHGSRSQPVGSSGSSPLARGLRRVDGVGAEGDRIIPARAGFTAPACSAAALAADHPRSRGVYCPLGTRAASATGSSPLARGLRGGRTVQTAARGIIPARAGFTGPRSACPGRSRDHPRSRGVYDMAALTLAVGAGSSPLARGLRPPPQVQEVHPGIIPARAGFTHGRPDRPPHPPDHPRSRGVYMRVPDGVPGGGGSSPLARGLLPGEADEEDAARIIPARAGFTPRRACGRRAARDHPRSRGVYPTEADPYLSAMGSSPLARGLPGPLIPRPPRPGIIPARAGFTVTARLQTPRTPDHPRSRGVYGGPGKCRHHDGGSSPLARGLRQQEGNTMTTTRIIPARAGFTVIGPPSSAQPWDHPRSRGVYSDSVTQRTPAGGIIPARAGFTSLGSSEPSGSTDHPRSRGVYELRRGDSLRFEGSSPLARGLPCGGRLRR